MSTIATATYTPEQSRAITTRDVSVGLAAGAGCGKTFVLTQRLMQELAPGEGRRAGELLAELVAITFTEAAARELRTRVRREAFRRWLDTPEERPYWQELLRRFDNCRISTIHSFCINLIRAHAFELGLDPLITVLDQAAANVLVDESMEEAVRELLAKRDPDMIDLASEWNIDGVQWRLASLMAEYRQPEFHEWATKAPGEVVANWRDYYQTRIWPLQQAEIADRARELMLVLLDHPGAHQDDRVDHLLQLLDQLARKDGDEQTAEEVIALAKANSSPFTKKNWQDDSLFEAFKNAAGVLRETLRKLGPPDLTSPATFRAAELGIKLARVALHAAEVYQQRKVAQGALDFDDQLAYAHELLTSERFAQVRHEASRQIRLLMVDEFQDTDHLQAAIVRELVGNLTESNRLFFVGDEKQSIYRFRKANPEVFRRMRGELSEAGQLPLSTNFRSQPALLQFVNRLFGHVFGDSYQSLIPFHPQVTEEPCIEFLWTVVPPDAADDEEGDGEGKSPRVDFCRRAEARTIAARLRQLFDGETKIVRDPTAPGGARPPRYGDVAILFRALSNVQYYEEALRELGIDYYLVGGHAFYSQQEIFDLVNLLRSVASECDEVSLAGVLRSPFFSLCDETLYWLVAEGGGLAAGLFGSELPPQLDSEEQLKVVAARRILSELRQRKDTLSVPELLELAFERTGYDAALLAEFMGQRKLANVQKLIEQARAAAESGVGKLSEFVTQLSKFSAEQPKEALAATSPETANVVRLMTVHQAKGLEFPVVVVADASRKHGPSFVSAVFDPDLGPLVKPSEMPDSARCGLDLHIQVERKEEEMERQRLFYVACTRAEDYLLLSGATSDLQKPTGWMNTLGKAFDLSTGELLAPGDEAPQVRVLLDSDVPPPPRLEAERKRSLATHLEKATQKAAHGSLSPPPLAAPVELRPEWIRRFSVTRLSGRLMVAHRTEADSDQGLSWQSTEEPYFDEEARGVDPIALGNLVHAVLERLDYSRPEDLPRWCDIFAPQYNLLAAGELTREALAMLTPFVGSPRIESMRKARWLEREVEFNLSWPPGETDSRYLQGYLDCLYEDQQGVLRIVDYKTNLVTPSGVPHVARTYELQMLLYALAVERALKRPPDEMVLCFLRPGVEYSWKWDDTTRSRAVQMVDAAIAEFERKWFAPAHP